VYEYDLIDNFTFSAEKNGMEAIKGAKRHPKKGADTGFIKKTAKKHHTAIETAKIGKNPSAGRVHTGQAELTGMARGPLQQERNSFSPPK